MMRRTRIVLATVAISAVATACGGGDDASDDLPVTVSGPSATADGIDLADWQARTSIVCEQFEPQQDAVVAAHPQASEPADVVALIDELTPIVDRYIEALRAIEVPNQRKTDVERTHALNQMNADAAARLRTAAAAGDQDAMQSAAQALDQQSTELKALFTDLGVPACA
jgi:ABC-type glycerol-3-phosphate transport system substrate-binding protein